VLGRFIPSLVNGSNAKVECSTGLEKICVLGRHVNEREGDGRAHYSNLVKLDPK
jgi:hypothetical protein